MRADDESVHALTGAYVLDALEPEELVAFERHLAVCPDCRADVRSLRDAVMRLPASSEAAPPPELRAGVLDAIARVRPLPPLPEQEPLPDDGSDPAAQPQQHEVTPIRRRAADRSRRWQLVAAAACVVALGSVLWSGLRPPAPDLGRELTAVEQQDTNDLEALITATDLRVYAADGAGDMRGTVLLSDALGTAAVLLQDLPDLDADQVFQAWSIAGADPADAGVFRSLDGAAAVMLSGEVLSADAVALTVEPSGGSPAPTGDILIQVPLSQT